MQRTIEPRPADYTDHEKPRYNRQYRRALKKGLKIPFTPSEDFARAVHSAQVSRQNSEKEAVKVRVPRAFEKDELDDTAAERPTQDGSSVPGRDATADGDADDGDPE